MFTLLRLGALAALLGCGLSLPAHAASLKSGSMAEQQLRHIATYFPGRMAGSPAEMLTADYLQHQFSQLGYHSDQRRFNTRYQYQYQDGHQAWRNVNATSVIAAREGKVPQQIVIIAHSDSWMPHSDKEMQQNLGGLSDQGVDDNASGLGVMMELAARLASTPLHYSLRFVALSGEEIGQQGSEDYLSRMTPEEKHNTLLVINLDSLIIGNQLAFTSGSKTPKAVIMQTRDRAIALAHRHGISAIKLNAAQEQGPFDRAGFPLLLVKASDGVNGKAPRAVAEKFPTLLRHQAQRDNLTYIDRWLPGRITRRTHDSVTVLLPLIRELANP
ncbi:alkaline phosphatase [bacteria symbiont BFo1 of Frankliniella occidentalis]|jgi:alkaline phosphatase isozyme conversion protein|uniref:aminopeptidase n=1 Tax=Erwinia aphidicola TaxID=68334 RepID=UPI0006645DF1|nr:aminopeptidase [Erwinia aphidicola]KMV69123.1 alkaline phosphatase [bacteria symbiont BFo1 of Frankliniella occidentalis]PIJ59916.1 Zn-dependent exopeptidase M28 [Erwinia sp. OLMDLW33]KYP83612.1 alkaline phosphatase [bacteria symbiont BFo1 of Frankliniella occidentalis]KYP88852.1 alkaline phosphatase [bacteria symbiont BFo1 of Frankliniella occidentalis]CAH0263812.1 Aminopeptidase YwaD [Erwinia aphidicola]